MLRYREIAEKLEASLRAGGGGTARPLPSENDLCAQFEASRTTIRAALNQLDKRGLIERRQGSGTFYKPPHIAKHLGSLVDFHTEAHAAGRTPQTRVLSLTTRKPNAAEFALFGAEAARDGVVELMRLRSLDGEPAVLQRSWLARSVLGDARAEDLQGASLYRYLSEHHGISVASIEETLEPECVGSDDAAHLAIAPGTAVFRSHRTARDGAGQIIEVSDNLIRGDLYRFTVHRRLDGELA